MKDEGRRMKDEGRRMKDGGGMNSREKGIGEEGIEGRGVNNAGEGFLWEVERPSSNDPRIRE